MPKATTYKLNKSLQGKRQYRARKAQTTPQRVLFEELRKHGFRIIPEKMWFKPYVIRGDGYIPRPYRVNLEVDGPYHDSEEQKVKDARRDRDLRLERNVTTIRVSNAEVMENLGTTVMRIVKNLEQLGLTNPP